MGNVAQQLSTYSFTVSFPVVSGMHVGTPVRVRGVPVGQVVALRTAPSRDSVQATVEITEPGMHLPKSALIEANQVGVWGETMIDVLPAAGEALLDAALKGPRAPECGEDGVLICHREHVEGVEGYGMSNSLGNLWRLL